MDMSIETEKTVIREDIEWISLRWHDEPNRTMPRVLLVGDSIVVGHGANVHALLKDRICVDYFATSKHVTDVEFMPDLAFMLCRRNYELILFNNGLHGFGVDDELYGPALLEILTLLSSRAPRLAWRSSTPVRNGDNRAELGERTPRVVRRNAAAAAVAQKLCLPTLDLYTPMLGHPEFYSDGAHCNQEGVKFQAEIIAAFIDEQLARSKP